MKIQITLLTLLLCGSVALASNWPCFRGPGSYGQSDETNLPLTWSETENLAWKTALPGPGSSTPIVWGDRVYVTCYSGYGLDPDNPGDITQLKRHLICLQIADGKIIWDKTVPATQPEDPFRAMMREHGYASNTPATDGERIYAFFGKTGALAFDLAGKQIWHSPLGTDSDQRKWGSGSSVTLYEDLVLINAYDESKTLYALSKKDGKEIWKRDLSGTGLTFGTPVVAQSSQGRQELILNLPNQIWSLNPRTGATYWTASTSMADTITGTPVVANGILYAHGGGPRSRCSMAVRLGGSGDVTETHVLWSGQPAVASVPSLVTVKDHAYWIDSDGTAYCQDLKTGATVYQETLDCAGRFAVYASTVLADGKLYAPSRKGGIFVLAPTPEFKVLGHNRFADDTTDFSGSPAISQGRLFFRSNQAIYCVKTP